MTGFPRLLFEGSQAAAFLIVVASLAARVSPNTERPPLPERVTNAAAEEPEPVVAPEPLAAEEPKREPPRLAIGFNPIAEEPKKDAPELKDDAGGRAIPLVQADEPEPIRLPAPRGLANAAPRVHKPFDSSAWVGPKVIVLRGDLNAARVAQRRVPPPPKPDPRLGGKREFDKHTVRQHWETDVEQFRALAKAGYKIDALQQVFGARYPHLRSAASSGIALDALPPPPEAYIEALAPELRKARL